MRYIPMLTIPYSIDLDLVGSYCPMAFVKLTLFIEKLENKEVFTALYENTPANEPLIRSITAAGHTIIDKSAVPHETDPRSSAINNHLIAEKKITLLLIKVQVKK